MQVVLALCQDGGEFAESLAHEAGLHTHCGHAHFAFEFGFGHERGDRIDDDDVEGIGAGECFANGQGFFAAVRLGDEQVIQIHAELFGISRIEGVLGIDERRETAGFLGVGDDVEHQRGFAGGFRAENFNDAAARQCRPRRGRDQPPEHRSE